MRERMLLRRRAVIGSLACLSIVRPSAAQVPDGPRISPIDAWTEFNLAGGRVTLLEHEPASARLRTGGPLKVRFQLEATEFDGRWVPILGFSIADSDRSNELQVDFAEAPGYERLVLAATSINRAEKKREPLTQVMVPHFSVRDVHEFELIIDPSSATIVIHGQRRAFTLAHRADRLIVRPSGVKGWIEFPDPAFA